MECVVHTWLLVALWFWLNSTLFMTLYSFLYKLRNERWHQFSYSVQQLGCLHFFKIKSSTFFKRQSYFGDIFSGVVQARTVVVFSCCVKFNACQYSKKTNLWLFHRSSKNCISFGWNIHRYFWLWIWARLYIVQVSNLD